MRALLQRVTGARVRVDGAVVGEIGHGYLVLLGVSKEDEEADAVWLADKVVGLRVFSDEQGKMNKSVKEVGGSLLVVSQFTLYGDCRKGRRPSFDQAASGEKARRLYERFVALAKERGVAVETGIFQAQMAVELINDGPVTILCESKSGIG